VKSVIRSIAKEQGVKTSDRVLELIAQNANGDLRSAIRDFQAIAQGETEVREEDTLVVGDRQIAKSMYDLLGDVLHGTNPLRARSVMMEVNEAPEYVLLWLDENLPIEYRNPDDLVRGYDALSRSDVFLGRVSRRQYFGFWSYASDLMSYGINVAKESQYHELVRYRFPLYLVKMSRTKGLRGIKHDLSLKLGVNCHLSSKAAMESLLPYFKLVFQRNKDFRIAMTMTIGLDPEELAYLFDQKIDSHAVRHLISDVQKVQRAQSTETKVPIIEETQSSSEEVQEKRRLGSDDSQLQRSLFEY
jgi:replication factor C large subunit